MRIFQGPQAPGGAFGVAEIWQMNEFEENRQERENSSSTQIRNFDGIRSVRARVSEDLENQDASDDRADGRA